MASMGDDHVRLSATPLSMMSATGSCMTICLRNSVGAIDAAGSERDSSTTSFAGRSRRRPRDTLRRRALLDNDSRSRDRRSSSMKLNYLKRLRSGAMIGTLKLQGAKFYYDVSSQHASGHLSLRGGSNRDSPPPSHAHELQLLDLPPIRGSLGLLQSSRRTCTLQTRRHRVLLLGPQGVAICSLQDLRMPHPLEANPAEEGRLHGCQRQKLRSGCI
jgi:hypothetical protein